MRRIVLLVVVAVLMVVAMALSASTAFAGGNGWGPCKGEKDGNATGRSEPDQNCGHHEGDDGDPVGEGPKGWWAYYGCQYGGPNNCR
jgi:hypothetical protein